MQTTILDALSASSRQAAIAGAAGMLRAGEVVAFPTETVYGLGADALNPAAIARVFQAKGRPSDNPLIVHVGNLDDLRLCARVTGRAQLLIDAFMPGPLTLVLPSEPAIPPIARAGLPTVALRVPAHPVAAALLLQTGPLVAPSANLSGRPSPTTAAHVYDDLQGRIPAILDGGPCRLGIESTVVDLSGEHCVVLRPGVITQQAIEQVLGEPVRAGGHGGEAPRAPGMKYRHYAPGAVVRVVMGSELPPPAAGVRRMILTTPSHLFRFPGEDVHLLEGSTLYGLFRLADARGIGEIIIYALHGELNAGLLDRIHKAAEE